MKKFTCLLIACLAISTVYSACPANAAAANNWQARCEVTQTGCQVTTAANSVAGTCGANAGTTNFCCDDAKGKAAVSAEITRVKGMFTDFGSSVARIGGMFAKIQTLVTASNVNTTLESAATADLSGATTTLFKTWATYSGSQFSTDFTAFKDQAVGCYDHYALAIQKYPCASCIATTADVALWTDAAGSVSITQASCNDWVSKCNKVWNFMHKLGWFVQVVAFLNKKKDTGSSVTFSPATNHYAAGLTTVADIDAAVTKCGSDAAATACTDTEKGNMCKAFIGIWSHATTGIAVGRSDKTFIQSSYNPTSTVTRRRLAAATGTIKIDAGGVDTTTTNTLVFPPTSAIATIDVAAWSHGYVAPAASGSSSGTGGGSSTTSSKNANVLIGTVLSAIFAVALLN